MSLRRHTSAASGNCLHEEGGVRVTFRGKAWKFFDTVTLGLPEVLDVHSIVMCARSITSLPCSDVGSICSSCCGRLWTLAFGTVQSTLRGGVQRSTGMPC
eukprot:3220122-Amphidinium_carterae.1